MTNTNINDIIGMQEKEREYAQFLAEIIKILGRKEEEFKDALKLAVKPENLVEIIPHLSMKKDNKLRAMGYITQMATSIQIAETEGVPKGFVGDLSVARIKFQGFMIRFISEFKKEDMAILADLGLKMRNAVSKHSKSNSDGEEEYG